jgi:hypothetical protein
MWWRGWAVGCPCCWSPLGGSYILGLFLFGDGKGAVIFAFALPAFFVYAIYVSGKESNRR